MQVEELNTTIRCVKLPNYFLKSVNPIFVFITMLLLLKPEERSKYHTCAGL
jgi:hypothetical protein